MGQKELFEQMQSFWIRFHGLNFCQGLLNRVDQRQTAGKQHYTKCLKTRIKTRSANFNALLFLLGLRKTRSEERELKAK